MFLGGAEAEAGAKLEEEEEDKGGEAGGGREERGEAEGTERGKYATGTLCILQSLLSIHHWFFICHPLTYISCLSLTLSLSDLLYFNHMNILIFFSQCSNMLCYKAFALSIPNAMSSLNIHPYMGISTYFWSLFKCHSSMRLLLTSLLKNVTFLLP